MYHIITVSYLNGYTSELIEHMSDYSLYTRGGMASSKNFKNPKTKTKLRVGLQKDLPAKMLDFLSRKFLLSVFSMHVICYSKFSA